MTGRRLEAVCWPFLRTRERDLVLWKGYIQNGYRQTTAKVVPLMLKHFFCKFTVFPKGV